MNANLADQPITGNSFPRIFVSYKREDHLFAEQLVALLRRIYKYDNVWLDPDLSGGQDWWSEIVRQIESRDIFLYVLSQKSLTSLYCRAEYSEAIRCGKSVIPIATERSINFQSMLGRIHVPKIPNSQDDNQTTVSADYLAEIMRAIVHRGSPQQKVDSQSLWANRNIQSRSNEENTLRISLKVPARVEPNNENRHLCNTGIFLQPDDKIEVRVTGEITIDNGTTWMSADGVIKRSSEEYKDWIGLKVITQNAYSIGDGIRINLDTPTPAGSLFGWIGEDEGGIDKSFPIGTGQNIPRTHPGYLHIAVTDNKGEYGDNQGFFDLVITLGKHT